MVISYGTGIQPNTIDPPWCPRWDTTYPPPPPPTSFVQHIFGLVIFSLAWFSTKINAVCFAKRFLYFYSTISTISNSRPLKKTKTKTKQKCSYQPSIFQLWTISMVHSLLTCWLWLVDRKKMNKWGHRFAKKLDPLFFVQQVVLISWFPTSALTKALMFVHDVHLPIHHERFIEGKTSLALLFQEDLVGGSFSDWNKIRPKDSELLSLQSLQNNGIWTVQCMLSSRP